MKATQKSSQQHRGKGKAPSKRKGAEVAQADILAIATREFAEKGLSGARIDNIAARTRTSKRMIYYYFKSKRNLYIAVLEESYRKMRSADYKLQTEQLSPQEALRQIVSFTFDQHRANPDFIRLVMNENLHSAQFLRQSKKIRQLHVPAVDTIRRVLDRGIGDGTFRDDIDPLDLHMSISALSFFNVSNQYTFSTTFGIDMSSDAAHESRKTRVADMIAALVKKE